MKYVLTIAKDRKFEILGNTQAQVIGQAEILPVVSAKWTWLTELEGKRVLYFIDNDSARFALIRSYSPVPSSARLLWAMSLISSRSFSYDWFTRVQSFSNCGDHPSRLRFHIKVLGVIPTRIDTQKMSEKIFDVMLHSKWERGE